MRGNCLKKEHKKKALDHMTESLLFYSIPRKKQVSDTALAAA